MKKTLLSIAALASLSFAFADNYSMTASGFNDIPTATSFTNTTTSGVFYNDVDDFISVNDFSNVEFEKFFGFGGYNYNGGNAMNFGFAKHLKPCYFGFFFGGQLDGFKMENKFSDDSDYDKLNYKYTADSTKGYTGSILLGFDKFAIKTSLLYNPVGGKSTYTEVKPADGDESKVQEDVYELYGDIQIGLSGKYSPHFEIGLDSWTAKKYDNSKGYADKGFSDLYLRAGITYDLNSDSKDSDKKDSDKKDSKKETKKSDDTFFQAVDFDVDTRWRFTPIIQNQNKDGSDEHLGFANNLIQIKPTYKATINATEKFTLGTKLAIPLQFGVVGDEDSSKPIKGDKAYNVARVTNTDIGFVPSLALGITYAAVPEKVQFNYGTTIDFGELGWNIVTTQTRKDADTASIDKTYTDVSFGFDSSAFNTNWTAGFTLFFGKTVTFDASYNILNKLNNNSVNYRTGNNDIWETVQDVFVQRLEFLLSVKL